MKHLIELSKLYNASLIAKIWLKIFGNKARASFSLAFTILNSFLAESEEAAQFPPSEIRYST